MVRLVDCLACQAGDHAHHVEVVKAVPEGVMGSASCFCKGDCAERNKDRPNPIIDALVDAIARSRPSSGSGRGTGK